MSNTIMLISTDINVGLTSVTLGVIHLIEKKGINLTFFKPINQLNVGNKDQINKMLYSHTNINIAESLNINYVKSLLAKNQKNILMEEIFTRYYESKKQSKIILIEGLVPNSNYPFVKSLNYDIAKTLGADIIFVVTLNNNKLEQLKEHIELTYAEYGGKENKNIIGVIINKFNSPVSKYGYVNNNLLEILNNSNKDTIIKINNKMLTDNISLPIFGCIPWNFDLITIRCIYIANHLNATIINKGALQTRCIKSIVFCTNTMSNIVKLFHSGSLIVTSSDRLDIIASVCLSAINGIKIGALLLTNSDKFNKSIHKLCNCAFKTNLPVLMVKTNIWQTSLNLQNFNLEIQIDDHDKIKKIQNYISSNINSKWIDSLKVNPECSKQLSPFAFRYKITELARKANKCIILPEGNEPRTIKAAAICAQKNIANCILLGDPNEIRRVASSQGVKLGSRISIIEPKLIYKNYIERLVELRKNKGITNIIAHEQLKNNIILGTMMLEKNEVDGLVSGAINTTANIIRPSLQLIKTSTGNSIVSSIFFMLLPDQVLVYGDCAINPNPTYEQLSEIAIQSADSAKNFGIEPRVAMISYSTGNSGIGSDVEKVRKATILAQEKRPNLIIDGPLQYDAAIMKDVAKYKAPNSPVAGRATVFIFPDLNTGNTTYKAVQRSANLVSIGPILQGMRKPVNDLSRGALIDDIIYTIAITAIQATK
ncbi:MAG: phosphate acetyltransferase [Arsenophonus endosymbiont of Ceratovacuna japonica]